MALSLLRKRDTHPMESQKGRPKLTIHRPPRGSSYRPSAAAQEIRLRMGRMSEEVRAKGKSRLRAMAKARGGKHQVGYMKEGLGAAYNAKLKKVQSNLVQVDSNRHSL